MKTIIQRASRLLLITSLVGSLGLLAGCGLFSPDESKEVVEATPYLKLTTPENVISNFIRAYNERNITEYEKLRHEDFKFVFANTDIELSGNPEGTWTRDQDTESTENMFTDGVDPEGRAVQSILLILTPQSEWSSDVEPEFAGSQRKTYSVNMDVVLDNEDILRVTGLQVFWVTNVAVDGATADYRLLNWRDEGADIVGKVASAR